MHDERSPSFNIFPAVQRFICWSCYPEYGTATDLVKGVLRCSDQEALEVSTRGITVEKAFEKKLVEKYSQKARYDTLGLAIRINKLFKSNSYNQVLDVMKRIDEALVEERFNEIDNITKNLGI
jgi:DNA primase